MRTFGSVGLRRGVSRGTRSIPSLTVPAEAAPGRRMLRPRRVLLMAAMLSFVCGVALLDVAGRRSSVPVAAVHAHGFSQKGLLSLPLAAQGPVSAALGDNNPAYRVSPEKGGFGAASPAQHLASSFSSSGVIVTSGGIRVGLSLRDVGYGSSMTPVGQVAPTLNGNRVLYARFGLSEWYANGPLGLEQAFTIAKPPRAGDAATPLTLSIALSGDARASLAERGQRISFASAGKTSLSYTGLSASDARGHTLRSWLQLEGSRLLLRVDASNARYPLRIDPFIQQGAKLTGSGESGKGEFGTSVALSPDGNTALVGASEDNGNVGAAWVFTRSGSKWTEQQKLTGAGESGEGRFGGSVALSQDGETALIGAPDDNGDFGAAWAFTRSGSKWTEQQKLEGTGENGQADFGWSVALSSEGDTALIGGVNDNKGLGAAWVFTRSGSKWAQQGSKLPGDRTPEGFGASVALSSDGDTALIGGEGDGSFIGAAWVYTRSGSTWSEQQKLTATGGTNQSRFGRSVALSPEGNTALIGGPLAELDTGAAWVFTRSGSTWTEQQELTGTGESGEGVFGSSVALSSEGNTALIGGSDDNGGLGAAWAFTRSGSTWTQQGSKLTGGEEIQNSHFGSSVALSSDGDTALVGGLGDNTGVGAAWVFVNAPPATVTTQPASEVTRQTAKLNATVNPNGAEVTGCKFEYGTTESYGESEPCSVLPGSGESPVAVSASLTKLVTDTTYHFRISATNENGTSYGIDQTFTTLETLETGSTNEPTVPAEAKDKELSVKATEGTGSVTVGAYGQDIGGPPLARSKGAYFQIYHSEGSSFKTIEYKDCELGGAKTIWWDNPSTGWEPISEPTALYSEATHCITVTATESTTPSIAQLSDPRHVGGPAGIQEFGKCEPLKHGQFEDAGCTKEKYKEKNGVRSYKGKYHWYAVKVECLPLKHGHYADEHCSQKSESKKGKGTGGYEKAVNTFTTSSKHATLEASGLPTIECEDSTATGAQTDSKQGFETITFSGCQEPNMTKCTSEGDWPGTIETNRLESYTFEESGYYEVLAGDPIAVYTCGGPSYTLTGAMEGSLSLPLNTMTTTGEAKFGAGQEDLEVLDAEGVAHAATLSTTTSILEPQSTELRATH